MCACEIAEYYCVNGTDGRNLKSESVGGYSVSYGSDSQMTADDELKTICKMWLPNHLMYRGAGKCF